MIDRPVERKPGEGLYEWYYGSVTPIYMDLLTLERELKTYLDARKVEFLLDRLQNFRRAFINLTTKEIST